MPINTGAVFFCSQCYTFNLNVWIIFDLFQHQMSWTSRQYLGHRGNVSLIAQIILGTVDNVFHLVILLFCGDLSIHNTSKWMSFSSKGERTFPNPLLWYAENGPKIYFWCSGFVRTDPQGYIYFSFRVQNKKFLSPYFHTQKVSTPIKYIFYSFHIIWRAIHKSFTKLLLGTKYDVQWTHKLRMDAHT